MLATTPTPSFDFTYTYSIILTLTLTTTSPPNNGNHLHMAWTRRTLQLKYVDDSTTPDTEKSIPIAAGNRDYVAYVAWVAEGNTATPYVQLLDTKTQQQQRPHGLLKSPDKQLTKSNRSTAKKSNAANWIPVTSCPALSKTQSKPSTPHAMPQSPL